MELYETISFIENTCYNNNMNKDLVKELFKFIGDPLKKPTYENKIMLKIIINIGSIRKINIFEDTNEIVQKDNHNFKRLIRTSFFNFNTFYYCNNCNEIIKISIISHKCRICNCCKNKNSSHINLNNDLNQFIINLCRELNEKQMRKYNSQINSINNNRVNNDRREQNIRRNGVILYNLNDISIGRIEKIEMKDIKVELFNNKVIEIEDINNGI